MFGGRHWWYNGKDKDLVSAVSVWSWDDVSSVGTVPEGILDDMPEPKCVVYWLDSYIYLQAHPLEVQRAWRQHRKRQQARRRFSLAGILSFFRNS